jgi:hypothetical protein
MFRGSMVRAQEISKSLEEYFQTNQTWQGAEALLNLSGSNAGMMGHGRGAGSGQGMMNQRLRLANVEGKILYDTSTAQAEGNLTAGCQCHQQNRGDR